MNSRVIKGKATSMTQPFHYAGQKGYNYYHSGVDLTGFNGSYNILDWIVAHSDGVVVDLRTNCTGYEDGSYGNYVLLKHANGYFTMYAHLAFGYVSVTKGQSVKKGQILGYMDNTGHSFGGHLHWEVRTPQGVCIDPEPYINADLPGAKPSPTPKPASKQVSCLAYDAKTKKWLPIVTSGSKATDTIGKTGHATGAAAVYCADQKIRYAVHVKGGKWLPEVTGYNVKDAKNGYAGNGKAIDGLIIFGKGIKYQAKLRDGQKWLGIIKSEKANYKDAKNGYAGIIGQVIDEIKIWRY